MELHPILNPANLSTREIEVVKYLCKECTGKEIADKLFISPKTVTRHRENIMRKIGALSAIGIVIYAMKNNLLE